jgi:hypothetical protein
MALKIVARQDANKYVVFCASSGGTTVKAFALNRDALALARRLRDQGHDPRVVDSRGEILLGPSLDVKSRKAA